MPMSGQRDDVQPGQTGADTLSVRQPQPAGCTLRLRHNVNPSIQSHACIGTHVVKGPGI